MGKIVSNGQIRESEFTLLVCVVDSGYGKTHDGELLDELRAQLETRYDTSFEDADVAPGYSLPAFGTLIEIVSNYWPLLIAAFFSAKPASENLEIWKLAAKRVRTFFVEQEVVLGRNAAAAIAIEAVMDDMGGLPKSITCLGYRWRDRRFEQDDVGEIGRKSPPTEYLSMSIHVFDIVADGVQFEVRVIGKEVSLTRK